MPGQVDLVIAGFSCVDNSTLNSKRRTIDQGGESADTLTAILKYAEHWRPCVVVLENVCNAQWDVIKKMWNGIDYAAEFARRDTKNFYLPQTRQRVYMICIDRTKLKSADAAAARWVEVFDDFRRQASSPFGDFILPRDDPRAQEQTLERRLMAGEAEIRESNWETCRGRHEMFSDEHRLRECAPLTGQKGDEVCPGPGLRMRVVLQERVEARHWVFGSFVPAMRVGGEGLI